MSRLFGLGTKVSHLGQIVDYYFTIYVFQGRYIRDLYDLAHVAGWEACNLRHLLLNTFLGRICTIHILHIL